MELKPELSNNTFGFAKYLRNRGAINNYKHEGSSVHWFKDDGSLVSTAVFDNQEMTFLVYVEE